MNREQHILEVLTGEACWIVVKFRIKNEYSPISYYQDPKIIEKSSRKYNAPQIWRICKWIVNQKDRKGLYYIADHKDPHGIVDIMEIYKVLKETENSIYEQ